MTKSEALPQKLPRETENNDKKPQVSQYSSQDLKQAPSEYKAEPLALEPAWSLSECFMRSR
jgi:hypothetical protein